MNVAVKKMIPKATVKKASVVLPTNQIMIKKREAILLKEISFLEKSMEDYKLERKASWKLFKNKMKADLNQIKKSISELTHLND
jgi:phage pi2 protein 07